MDKEVTIELNNRQTRLVVSQVREDTIRINAYGLKSILHVIPQANNCVELKVVKYKDD